MPTRSSVAAGSRDKPVNALDEWFIATILPHEASLVRYLHRVWRNRAEIPDIRQEIYIRIYQGAARSKPDSPKSFLFTTARNLLADRARREQVVSINYTNDSASLDVLTDELSPERQHSADEELQRLAEAYDQLSQNYREVIWLLRVEGMTQKEAAQRLRINEGTLESRLSRALAALTRAVAHEHLSRRARSPGRTSRPVRFVNDVAACEAASRLGATN